MHSRVGAILCGNPIFLLFNVVGDLEPPGVSSPAAHSVPASDSTLPPVHIHFAEPTDDGKET